MWYSSAQVTQCHIKVGVDIRLSYCPCTGNDSAEDERLYLKSLADGMLRKTTRFPDLVTDVTGWVEVARERALTA